MKFEEKHYALMKKVAVFAFFLFAIFVIGAAVGFIFSDFSYGFVIIQPENPQEQLALDIAQQLNLTQNQTLQLIGVFNSALNRSVLVENITQNITFVQNFTSGSSFFNYTLLNETLFSFSQFLNNSATKQDLQNYFTKDEVTGKILSINGSSLQAGLANEYQVELTNLRANMSYTNALLAMQRDYEDKLRGGNFTVVDVLKLRSDVDILNSRLSSLDARFPELQANLERANAKNIPSSDSGVANSYVAYFALVAVAVIAFLYSRSVGKAPKSPWQPSSRPVESSISSVSDINHEVSQQVPAAPLQQPLRVVPQVKP